MSSWYLAEEKVPIAPSSTIPTPWELIGFFSQQYGKRLDAIPSWVLNVWDSKNRIDYSGRPNSLHLRGTSFHYRIDYQTVQAWVSNPGGKEVDFYIYRRPR